MHVPSIILQSIFNVKISAKYNETMCDNGHTHSFVATALAQMKKLRDFHTF